MIRISQIKLPAEHTKVQLEQKIKKAVHHETIRSLRGLWMPEKKIRSAMYIQSMQK